MPLPKPSKMISKRFNKPQTTNPFISPPPHPPSPPPNQSLPPHKLWPDLPLRSWRLRVVCTDPDATDDSSDDELDSSTSSHKRFIHEIFLPVPLSSLPQPSISQRTRPRRRRRSPTSNRIARSRKLCYEFRHTEATLQDVDALFDAASEICVGGACPGSLHDWATILPDPEPALGDEEFSRFLSEFVNDIGGNCAWEEGMDGSGTSQECEIADMLNLELDSEALTWINSLQRLP